MVLSYYLIHILSGVDCRSGDRCRLTSRRFKPARQSLCFCQSFFFHICTSLWNVHFTLPNSEQQRCINGLKKWWISILLIMDYSFHVRNWVKSCLVLFSASAATLIVSSHILCGFISWDLEVFSNPRCGLQSLIASSVTGSVYVLTECNSGVEAVQWVHLI